VNPSGLNRPSLIEQNPARVESPFQPFAPLAERVEKSRAFIRDDRERAMFDRAVEEIDPASYKSIQDKYLFCAADVPWNGFIKYLDVAAWFRQHVRIARFLDLDRRQTCTIFDIGSGGGEFLAVAKALGHQVLAFDRPEPALYGDLVQLFGIERIEGSIILGEALPPAINRFDTITINCQSFDELHATFLNSMVEALCRRLGRSMRKWLRGRNIPKPREIWSVKEWASFLEYLAAEHLNYPGEIFIGLNKNAGPPGQKDFLWPLIDLLGAHGAHIDEAPRKIRLMLDEPLRFGEIAAPPWRSLSRRKN